MSALDKGKTNKPRELVSIQEQGKRHSFLSRLGFGFGKRTTKHPKDFRGKLAKDGEFKLTHQHTRDPASFAKHTSKQVERTKPDFSKQELDAAIKLGRFVTVRRRLRQIAAQRRKVQRYIRSILVFLLFIFVFVNRNSSSDEDLFFSSRSVSEVFVEPLDFGEIVTVAHMWEWLSGTMCNNYYGQDTFDGVPNIDRDHWLLGTYRKVGGLRIGTLRVKKKPCGIASKMFNATDNQKLICYGYGEKNVWDEAVEDKADYGKDPNNEFVWSGWNGTDAAARRDEGWAVQQGTYPNAHQYSSPAFGFVLPQTNKEQALASLEFAKHNGYVDFHSRMLMLDMTLLNGQTKSLMTLRFMFAMTKAGGVIPTYEFMQAETEAIDFANTNFADMDEKSVWMLLEIMFYVYFVLEILLKMWFDQCLPANPEIDGPNVPCWKSNFIYRPSHFLHHMFTELPDLFQMLNVIFYGGHWVLRIWAASNSPHEITFDTDSYIPIRRYSETLAYKRYAMVLVIFCVFFRFIFYLAIVPEFGVITKALTKSVGAVAGFMGVFFFFTVMFLMAGIQLFGTKLEGFRNLPAAFWSIFQMAMLQENLIEDMLAADRNYISGLYIILFYIINTVMLMNMAIAIISDAYTQSRMEVDSNKDTDIKIGREIKRYFMLRIWKIPFFGGYIKNRYINYGNIKRQRIRRAMSGDISLHKQMKLQQQKIEQEKKGGGKKGSKYAVGSAAQTARITKTAAQQTLKELRQLDGHLKSLTEFVHSRIDSVGGGGGAQHESVEEFLFAHKKKNQASFSKSQPSFVVDGVSARNHAVVDVVEIDKGKKKNKKSSSEYGVL